MKMNRRTALALVGIGATRAGAQATHQHAPKPKVTPAADYKLQFFTAEEDALLDRVTEMILPADEHSPGAHEALVSRHIDFVVANSPEQTKSEWRARLAAFEKLAQEKYGQPFLRLGEAEQAALLELLATNERNPRTPAEHFFRDLKQATLFAYYTASVGLLQELGYKGNQVLDSFPGCPHPPGAHHEKF